MVMTARELRKVQRLDNDYFRGVIEDAGGVFLRIEGDGVYFRDRETGKELSLYFFACNASRASNPVQVRTNVDGSGVAVPEYVKLALSSSPAVWFV